MPWLLIACISPAIWGTTFIFASQFMADVPPMWATVERMLPAGIIMVLMTRWWPESRQVWLHTLTLGFVGLGIFSVFVFIAAYRLPGGIAGTLSATLPLQVIIANWIFYKRPPRGIQWLAGMAGIAGVGMMTLQGGEVSMDLWGVLAAFLSVSCIVATMLLTARWGIPEGKALGFAGWQMLFAGGLMVPVAFVMEGSFPMPTAENWIGIFWMVVPCNLIAYTIWISAIVRVESVKLSFVNLLNPVVALAAGWMFLHEQLSLVQWLGVMLVLASMIVAQLPTRRKIDQARAMS